MKRKMIQVMAATLGVLMFVTTAYAAVPVNGVSTDEIELETGVVHEPSNISPRSLGVEYTITGAVNLRQTASTGATILGSLYPGDKVKEIRADRPSANGYKWAYVLVLSGGNYGRYGYVITDYLK